MKKIKSLFVYVGGTVGARIDADDGSGYLMDRLPDFAPSGGGELEMANLPADVRQQVETQLLTGGYKVFADKDWQPLEEVFEATAD